MKLFQYEMNKNDNKNYRIDHKIIKSNEYRNIAAATCSAEIILNDFNVRNSVLY